jgi:hypothetical protein
MVNAKNITLAALATTVVAAVVGVEVYNNGSYKTQVAFHGSKIEAGEIYSESANSCDTLDRDAKGSKGACLDNATRMEVKLEMANGLVIAQIDDQVSIYRQSATGLVHVADAKASDVTVQGEGELPANIERATTQSRTERTVTVGDDFTIVIDSVNSVNAQPLDFSAEKKASRSLVSRAQSAAAGRKLWGRVINWCAFHCVRFAAALITCAGLTAAVPWLVYFACFSAFTAFVAMFYYCDGSGNVPTPSGYDGHTAPQMPPPTAS